MEKLTWIFDGSIFESVLKILSTAFLTSWLSEYIQNLNFIEFIERKSVFFSIPGKRMSILVFKSFIKIRRVLIGSFVAKMVSNLSELDILPIVVFWNSWYISYGQLRTIFLTLFLLSTLFQLVFTFAVSGTFLIVCLVRVELTRPFSCFIFNVIDIS